MLGDISFVILREIIKRIIEYESIDNLKLTNKRLNNFILNDLHCQEYYFSLRYPKIQINLDSYNLKELIKLLNSKKYSKFIETKIPLDYQDAVFVNPKNDSFIIISKDYLTRHHDIKFYCTNIKMVKILIYINDNYFNDFKRNFVLEKYFRSKNYFRLQFEIPEKYYKHHFYSGGSYFSWIPFNSACQTQFRYNIMLCDETFGNDILKIINEL